MRTDTTPPDPSGPVADVHELASIALFSLPATHEIAFLGDDWLRVRDVLEALTTGVMDAVSVLDCLHFGEGGSMVRPDLVPAVEALFRQEQPS